MRLLLCFILYKAKSEASRRSTKELHSNLLFRETKVDDTDTRVIVNTQEAPAVRDGVVSDSVGSPFDSIATRAPTTRPEHWEIPFAFDQQRCAIDPTWWNIYPSLRPKDAAYCPQMYKMFIYTCQPGKPLRIDLLQFCQDYSGFCGVPNLHRFPGPRLGTQRRSQSVGGNIGVGGNFGFGIGVVPGLDVGAGWGVDVGSFPWFNDNIDVGLKTGVGVLGSTSPEKVRRGEDNEYSQDRSGSFG